MKKAAVITALILIGVGLILGAGALLLGGRPEMVRFIDHTYPVDDSFENIRVLVKEADVRFAPSKDGTCSVACSESEKVRFNVSVKEGTLVIEETDTRSWTDRLFTFAGHPEATVYLPDSAYRDVAVESSTGGLEIPEMFSFHSIRVIGSTSDVRCAASATDAIDVRLSTGDIECKSKSAGSLVFTVSTGKISIHGTSVSGDVSVRVSTGKTEIDGLTCKSFVTEGTTGRIILKNTAVQEDFLVKRSTGDVQFENFDAQTLTVRTSTGDVEGTLRSEKVFVTKTSTGKVRVPSTTAGGKCEISTDTGDIEISIADSQDP